MAVKIRLMPKNPHTTLVISLPTETKMESDSTKKNNDPKSKNTKKVIT